MNVQARSRRGAMLTAQKHVCWGCGYRDDAASGKNFQQCPLCIELQLEPARFCSNDCYAANWKRHKAFHTERKAWLERSRTCSTAEHAASQPALAACEKVLLDMAELAQDTLPENQHVGDLLRGQALLQQQDYRGAAKACRKSLRRRATAEGHYTLGQALAASGDSRSAITSFMQAQSMTERSAPLWSQAAARLWVRWSDKGGRAEEALPTPEWMKSPAERLRVAEQAVEQWPDLTHAWQMLSHELLSAEHQDVKRSLACLKRAAAVTGSAHARQLLEERHACLEAKASAAWRAASGDDDVRECLRRMESVGFEGREWCAMALTVHDAYYPPKNASCRKPRWMDDLDARRQVALKVVRHYPESPRAWWMLGVAMLKARDEAKRVACCFERAAQHSLNDANTSVYRQLAAALKEGGHVPGEQYP